MCPPQTGSFLLHRIEYQPTDFHGNPVASPTGCGPAPAAPCVGSDLADFLLGYPANAKVQIWAKPLISATGDSRWPVCLELATCFRNLRSRLRRALRGLHSAHGNQRHIPNLDVSFSFGNPGCVTPQPITITTGSTTLTCTAGPTQSLFFGHYNNWAPRLGIAWQPPGKLFSGKHQNDGARSFSMFDVESYLEYSRERNGQPAAIRHREYIDDAGDEYGAVADAAKRPGQCRDRENHQYCGGKSELSSALRHDLEFRHRIQFDVQHISGIDVHRHARRAS